MKIKHLQTISASFFLQYLKINYYCYSCQFVSFAPNKEMNDMKYFVLKSDKCVTESTQKLNKTGKGAINYRQITAK